MNDLKKKEVESDINISGRGIKNKNIVNDKPSRGKLKKFFSINKITETEEFKQSDYTIN